MSLMQTRSHNVSMYEGTHRKYQFSSFVSRVNHSRDWLFAVAQYKPQWRQLMARRAVNSHLLFAGAGGGRSTPAEARSLVMSARLVSPAGSLTATQATAMEEGVA